MYSQNALQEIVSVILYTGQHGSVIGLMLIQIECFCAVIETK